MLRVLVHLIDIDEIEAGLVPTPEYALLVSGLWGDLMEAFALDELLIVDATTEQLAAGMAAEQARWRRFESLAEAEATYSDATWVYFEQGGQRLDTFDHPTGDVIYAFGPDSTGFAHESMKTYVEIPTARPHGLFSATAAAIALYDRFRRRA